jgi:hypothetical protein
MGRRRSPGKRGASQSYRLRAFESGVALPPSRGTLWRTSRFPPQSIRRIVFEAGLGKSNFPPIWKPALRERGNAPGRPPPLKLWRARTPALRAWRSRRRIGFRMLAENRLSRAMRKRCRGYRLGPSERATALQKDCLRQRVSLNLGGWFTCNRLCSPLFGIIRLFMGARGECD